MKVLIADDNRDHVLTLSTLLEGEGFDVRTALHAEEIVPLTESFRPDVCLLDIGMPRCDGYETAKKLRELHGRERLLIAVTAYASERDRARAREAGFDLHIAKPFMAGELIDMLCALARERQREAV
jgi:CheY-like chemotaxis protein